MQNSTEMLKRFLSISGIIELPISEEFIKQNLSTHERFFWAALSPPFLLHGESEFL